MSGLSLQTNFTIGAPYWLDHEDDLPLSYTYSAMGLQLRKQVAAYWLQVRQPLKCDCMSLC